MHQRSSQCYDSTYVRWHVSIHAIEIECKIIIATNIPCRALYFDQKNELIFFQILSHDILHWLRHTKISLGKCILALVKM